MGVQAMVKGYTVSDLFPKSVADANSCPARGTEKYLMGTIPTKRCSKSMELTCELNRPRIYDICTTECTKIEPKDTSW